MNKSNGFTTQRVHADRQLNTPVHGAVHEPISTSVLFEYAKAQNLVDVFQGHKAGHVYSRSSSGSVNALQNIINDLEGGVGAVCFSTGMAAISSTILSLFAAGDHLIVSQYLFGNTRSFFATLAGLGVQISYVDTTCAEDVAAAMQQNTCGVYCETIANPVTQVSDISGISALCEQHNLLFMVDSTMTPPPLFDAKSQGVALIFSSLTKYIGGHGNALGGAVIDTGIFDWTRFSRIAPMYRGAEPAQWGLTQIRKRGLRDLGATLSPESANSLAIGIETLGLRLDKACNNALKLAIFLEQHPAVAKVFYPGLKSHPQNNRCSQLFKYFGAILSFELQPNSDPLAFLDSLNLILCSTHLGDNRTLALPVAQTIFYENTAEQRMEMGISDNLIRMSVGIEEHEDLLTDLAQGLDLLG